MKKYITICSDPVNGGCTVRFRLFRYFAEDINNPPPWRVQRSIVRQAFDSDTLEKAIIVYEMIFSCVRRAFVTEAEHEPNKEIIRIGCQTFSGVNYRKLRHWAMANKF